MNTTLRLGTATLVALTTLAPCLFAQDATDLDELRAAALERLPDASHVRGVRGSARVSGVEHEFELAFDRAGHVALEVRGPLGGKVVVDGGEVWALDAGVGVPYPLELWFADAQRVFLAAWSGTWARADFPFELSEPRAAEGTISLDVASPRSSYAGTLIFDAGTKRAELLVAASAYGEVTWSFGLDAKQVAIVQLAGLVDRFDVASAFEEAADAGRFARPEARSANAFFQEDAPPDLFVERRPSGHLEFDVLVDGVESTFLFDTGAGHSTIDPAFAEELGLEPFGATFLAGGGEEVSTSAYVRADEVVVGPLALEGQRFTLMRSRDVYGGSGIVGWDVLVHAVVELDVDEAEVRLFDPRTYELEGAEWRPLSLYHRHPHFVTRFGAGGEAHEGLFRLDTGAGSISAMFHRPAVDRLRLLEGQDTIASTARGAGGVVQLRQGRVDWFEIEGQRFDRPGVLFCMDEKGALADPDSFGNLGQGFLAPFTVVFDYQHERIAFRADS